MNHCLNCNCWRRCDDDPIVGTCDAAAELLPYRFQYECCGRFVGGVERKPGSAGPATGGLITTGVEPNYRRIALYYAAPFGNGA